MDGFQVVAALQEEPGWRDIPVIVITSRDLDSADRERLNSGVQSVLVKETFRPVDLVERIRRLVHTKPTANREKATVRVRIRFDKKDPRILPDMAVKVTFLRTGKNTAETK